MKILSELKVIVPEKRKQDQFASFVKLTDKSKVAVQKALDEAQLLFGETAIIATMMQSSFHRITTIFLSILAMKAGKVLSWIELKVKLNITKIQITIRVDRGSMATL